MIKVATSMRVDASPARVETRDLSTEIQRLKRELKRQPANFDLYCRLGDKLRENAEIELAIDAYGKALELKSDPRLSTILELCKEDLTYFHTSSD